MKQGRNLVNWKSAALLFNRFTIYNCFFRHDVGNASLPETDSDTTSI